MSNETVTILRAVGDRRAQKVFIQGQAPRPYSAGSLFTFEQRDVSSLEQFADLLTEVEQDPTAFIIRGQPLPHLATGSIVHRRFRGAGAAFAERPTRVVCVDVDKVQVPVGISPCSDEAVECVIRKLPVEFHNASYVRQFSSSAGLSGQAVKVHLWWWLDRPCTDVEMRRWAEVSPVADEKIFNAVHPLYTARPAFDRIADPFEDRSRVGFVKKTDEHVAIALPERYTHPRGAPRDGAADAEHLIIRDDTGKAVDGREELLRNIRWRVLHDRTPLSEATFAEMVWAEFSERAQTGPTIHSGNSYTQEAVSRACARDWQRCGEIQPEPPRCEVSAEEAAAQLEDAIRLALADPGCTAIKATPGLGKSVITAAEIVALPDVESINAEVYAPTRKEQVEWCERLAARAAEVGKRLSIIPIYGRDIDNCPKYEIAADLARNQIPVTPSLCRGKGGSATVQCEHFETCCYRAQFLDTGPAIRVFNHAHLSTPRPRKVKQPRLIVIDEAFASSLTDISEPCLVGALRSTLFGLRAQFRRGRSRAEILTSLPGAEQTLHQIIKAIPTGRPLLDELRARGVTPECLRSAADVASARMPLLGLHPGKTAAAFRAEAKGSYRARFVLAIRALRALAIELETPRSVSHAVKWVAKLNEAKLCAQKTALRLRDHETVLILDADFEPEITAAFLPGVTCVVIEAKQNARFVQIEDRSMSKKYLGLQPDGEINKDAVEKLVGQFQKLPGKRKLVATYKKLVPHLKSCLPSARYSHFGGLRGTNDFEDCDTAIVLGRNCPPTDAVEDIARALHYASPRALVLSDPVPQRHAVGKGVLWSDDFFDERLQAVLRSIREAETRQAIGRLRLPHSREQKSVYIYSAQPIGIPVDQLIAFEPTKGEDLLKRLGGMLPTNPADLARIAGSECFPRGETQARNWRDEATKTGGGIEGIFLRRGVLVVPTSYRRERGRGRPSVVYVSVLDHPCPERSLPESLARPDEGPPDIVVKPLPWVEVKDDLLAPFGITRHALSLSAA